MFTTNRASRTCSFVVLSAICLGLCLAPSAWADSKTQVVTFNSWVEIPGAVLPAGRYVFRLADAKSERHEVQIFDQVSGILVASLPTIPQPMPTAVEDPIRLEPRPSPFQGPAVAEWFRPGSRVGEEFIYTPGMLIGEATVAANASELEPTNADLSAALTATPNQAPAENPTSADATAPVSPVTQPPETASTTQPEQAPQQAQPEAAPAQSPQETPATPSSAGTDTMPKTASEIPLILAIGVCALALAGLFYMLRSRMLQSQNARSV